MHGGSGTSWYARRSVLAQRAPGLMDPHERSRFYPVEFAGVRPHFVECCFQVLYGEPWHFAAKYKSAEDEDGQDASATLAVGLVFAMESEVLGRTAHHLLHEESDGADEEQCLESSGRSTTAVT